MPQATEQDRAWARKKFGTIDTAPIIAWLEQRGYKLNKDWTWTPPKGISKPTSEEGRAMFFLCDEWDFGGLK